MHILHLICGLAVPVCADDRQCYAFIQRIKGEEKMRIRTVKNNRGKKTNLFPCKAKDVLKNLLEINSLLLKEGYSKDWHYKANGEVFPF